MKFVDLNLYKAVRSAYSAANPEFSYYDRSLISYYFSGQNLLVENNFKDLELEFILALLSEINVYSRRAQILVITPNLREAAEITELLKSYLNYLEVKGVEKRELINFSLNRHILVGTPGMILDYLKDHPKNAKNIRQCYLINASEIFKLGYFSTIKRIFNSIQSRVGIIAERVDKPLISALSRLGIEYTLTSKKVTGKQKTYSKPKLLLASLNEVKNQNILVAVKKKKHLRLLKDFFKKKGFLVSDNYDIVYDYKNGNIIYLARQKDLKSLNIPHFDIVFNYNCDNGAELLRRSRPAGTLGQLKIRANETKDRLEEGLHRARTQLSRISPQILENSIKNRAETYENLAFSEVKLKSSDRIRSVLFTSLLPIEEITEEKI